MTVARGKRKPANRRKAGTRGGRTSTSWKPGQSGNPAGRPPLSPEQRAARAQAQAIIDAATPDAALVQVAMLKHPDFKARHVASSSILDRGSVNGIARVEAPLDAGGDRDWSRLNDDEVSLVRALTAKLHGKVPESDASSPRVLAALQALRGEAPDAAAAMRVIKRLTDAGALPVGVGSSDVVDAELTPVPKARKPRPG